MFFGKFRFLDGLKWTVGLTAEVKMRLQISLTQCDQGLTIALTMFYLSKKTKKNFEEIMFFGILSDLEISNWVRLERYQPTLS